MGKGKERGGKYGRNTAGVKHELHAQDWGTKREFIGSGLNVYQFKKPGGGLLIIHADNYADAWRLAKERGASQIR